MLNTSNGPLCTCNALQTWGRLSALISRLLQFLYADADEQSQGRCANALLNTSVDDPPLLSVGTDAKFEEDIAIFMLALRCIGLRLADHKAALGTKVSWVGAVFTFSTDRIEVAVKPEMLEELATLINEALVHNVIPARTLQKLAGKLSHVAGLPPTWRPFMHCLHAALASSTNAPFGCVWTHQVHDALC
eukprot:2610665-Amphidinium_carterae.1